MQWLLSLLFLNQEFSACECTHVTLGKKLEQHCKQYLITPSSAPAFPDSRFLWFKLWRLFSRFTSNSDFRDLELSWCDHSIRSWNSQTSGVSLNWLSREWSNNPQSQHSMTIHTPFPSHFPFPGSGGWSDQSFSVETEVTLGDILGGNFCKCAVLCAMTSSQRTATHPSHFLNNWVNIQGLFKSPAVCIIYITSFVYC